MTYDKKTPTKALLGVLKAQKNNYQSVANNNKGKMNIAFGESRIIDKYCN